MNNWLERVKHIADIGAGVGIVVVAALLVRAHFIRPVASQAAPPAVQAGELPESISLSGVFLKGDAKANVVILEYADFECPACKKFVRDTYPAMIAEFVETGRASLAFKHFPLPNHPMARPAALAAQCAGQQGRFWEFYDAIFGLAQPLSPAVLDYVTRDLALDQNKLSSCAAESVRVVDNHLEEAKTFKLRGTPAFIVGALVDEGVMRPIRRIAGAAPIGQFRSGVEEAEKQIAARRPSKVSLSSTPAR
jgi:protein-disulfide isomerase